MSQQFLLAIDQGTTSTRAILFDIHGRVKAQHQMALTQSYPCNGWVEHNPQEIWQGTVACCQSVIGKMSLSAVEIAGIGISNQRETTICWDKDTGKPIYPAIVWQDRRTANFCLELQQDFSIVNQIQAKTGLLVDPYFSATKIHWMLQHVDGARELAERGQLAFGTVDSYLIWQLTGGIEHVTDATNASRTLLFNIHTQDWDDELLELFDIPRSILPEVKDSNANFGSTYQDLFGSSVPITGVAGDQHAALVGQACFNPGMIKSTYGTGCFLMMNTGAKVVQSTHKMLSTVAYRINGKVNYALEGSIFVAGAAVQWLRDALNLIENASETALLAESVNDTAGVYLVPAFTGLGAPYWDPEARGAVLGLTRDTGIAHIVRAALEAVCYQTSDLLNAMQQDFGSEVSLLRVDGGMAVNNWLMQFLADVVAQPIERPQCTETSALGVAMLAGLGAGVYSSIDDASANWQLDKVFNVVMPADKRQRLLDGWHKAISKVVKPQVQ